MTYTRGVKLRRAKDIDLDEMASIEETGAYDPVSKADLRRWLEHARSERHCRGKRVWKWLHVACDAQDLVLGHVILAGENEVASVRCVLHPKRRSADLFTRLLTAALDAGQVMHGLCLAEWIISERQESLLLFARNFGFVSREVQPVLRDWFGENHDGFVLDQLVQAPQHL